MTAFFELRTADERRWHLDVSTAESPLDIWACERIPGVDPIPLHVFQDGDRVDFERTSFAIPVVSQRVAELFAEFAPNDVQRIPALVEGDDNIWEVINVVTRVDCINFNESIIQYYPPNHPEKPSKPRGVVKLVLDADRIGEHRIFRPRDWEIAFIVSLGVKEALESIGATGVEFIPVTLHDPGD